MRGSWKPNAAPRGIPCLRLMHEHAAVALSYGIYRSNEFDAEKVTLSFRQEWDILQRRWRARSFHIMRNVISYWKDEITFSFCRSCFHHLVLILQYLVEQCYIMRLTGSLFLQTRSLTYQIGTISLNDCSPQKTDFESYHDGADTHQSCKDGIHFVIFILQNSSDERS